jgi:hypothetical protein
MPIVSYGDKAIDQHVKYGAQLPTMHLYPINEAVHRVSTSETAFRFRDANFAEVILGVDLDPANNRVGQGLVDSALVHVGIDNKPGE